MTEKSRCGLTSNTVESHVPSTSPVGLSLFQLFSVAPAAFSTRASPRDSGKEALEGLGLT